MIMILFFFFLSSYRNKCCVKEISMDVIDERELFRSVSLIFRALLIVVSQPNLMFVWVFFFFG
jgi:hypothetical protein